MGNELIKSELIIVSEFVKNLVTFSFGAGGQKPVFVQNRGKTLNSFFDGFKLIEIVFVATILSPIICNIIDENSNNLRNISEIKTRQTMNDQNSTEYLFCYFVFMHNEKEMKKNDKERKQFTIIQILKLFAVFFPTNITSSAGILCIPSCE